MFLDAKYISLVVLVVQTTVLVLTMRYSRAVREKDHLMYLASTAVVMAEVFKLVCSFLLLWWERRTDSDNYTSIVGFLHDLRHDLTRQPVEMLKLAVPALLYTVQNNLLYIALSNLDAATYQVTYQLKIMTTAVFSVLMLGKHLTKSKWAAIVILMIGVAMVQMPTSTSVKTETAPTAIAFPRPAGTPWKGVVAVLLACCSSGFAGVYFEKIVKGTRPSVWLRNFQLAFFSVILGLGGVVVDGEAVESHGFFQGYTPLVWTVVVLQGLGGLIVAAVIKYADNILKGFATSVSLVFSAIISFIWLEDLHLTGLFVFGSTLVIAATMLYSQPESKSTPEHKPSPSNV